MRLGISNFYTIFHFDKYNRCNRLAIYINPRVESLELDCSRQDIFFGIRTSSSVLQL